MHQNDKPSSCCPIFVYKCCACASLSKYLPVVVTHIENPTRVRRKSLHRVGGALLKCQTLEDDNDSDHSSPHQPMTEMFASCRNNWSRYTSADLVALEMKWVCTSAGSRDVVLSRKKNCRWSTVCCFAGLLSALCWPALCLCR